MKILSLKQLKLYEEKKNITRDFKEKTYKTKTWKIMRTSKPSKKKSMGKIAKKQCNIQKALTKDQLEIPIST